jgi:predicted aconitase
LLFDRATPHLLVTTVPHFQLVLTFNKRKNRGLASRAALWVNVLVKIETDFTLMTRSHYITDGEQRRRHAHAWGRGGATVVAASLVGAVTMAVTLFVAKINPRWVSGGLLREGNP